MSDRFAKTVVHENGHSVVVPGSRVIRSAEVAHIGSRPVPRKGGHSIEVVTDDNVVKAIDVTCECGHKIRVWCSYETDDEIHNANKAV